MIGIQGIESSSDIDLRPAGDTEMQVREFQVNKLFHNLEDLSALCSKPGGIWALIECVHNDVDRGLPLKCKDSFQTLQKCVYAGLSGATTVGRIDG